LRVLSDREARKYVDRCGWEARCVEARHQLSARGTYRL